MKKWYIIFVQSLDQDKSGGIDAVEFCTAVNNLVCARVFSIA